MTKPMTSFFVKGWGGEERGIHYLVGALGNSFPRGMSSPLTST